MKQNLDTVLVGTRVVLVPYDGKYVEAYHAWMQDPELLRLTASEKLTLEEERANQISWREDPAKLTFIALLRERCFGAGEPFPVGAMAGDVNLFRDRRTPAPRPRRAPSPSTQATTRRRRRSRS